MTREKGRRSIERSGWRPLSGHGLWLTACLVVSAAGPVAAFDLSRAEVEYLDNGLTVVVLEDHTFPVVSVQMLYKVGARNEEVGRTGLAHYLEHMAFRATESFPETEVVSAIYAVGGEWHGYTWIDQTTYFETVPKEYLELALRIEAERLGSLLIPEQEVEAERGAVLSELHGYENDPGSVLLDAVVATSFLQHPYRNNTIGWESDVTKIEHRDLLDFYRRHYHPANAVLAVVGDASPTDVRRVVRQHFAALDAGTVTGPLRTVEPDQHGERRVRIEGQAGGRRFVMAYRAPSVRSPDWPGFLVLQEILGGGEGVNFLQNEWGTAVRPGSRLDDIADDLATWYPPSFDPYLFVVTGTPSAEVSMVEIESRIESRFESLRLLAVDPEELAAARARVAQSLIFDVQTTEDAAHQLASYTGYGALSDLLKLPAAIEQVTAAEIQRLVTTYLRPDRRTVGWYVPEVPARPGVTRPAMEGTTPPAQVVHRRASEIRPPARVERLEEPSVSRLSGGLPVIVQRVSVTPTAYLRVLVPSTAMNFRGDSSRDWPVWGHTSLNRQFLAGELAAALKKSREAWNASVPLERVEPAEIEDPALRLEAAFEELLGIENEEGANRPGAIVLVGDLDQEESLAALEEHFGDIEPLERPSSRPLSLRSDELRVRLPVPKAQAQLGYVVPAPPPSHADALAWRMLLYVLTHGYEGRLGKEAISRRGLIYYIDSSYRADGMSAWIALAMGVDPPKLAEMRQLLGQSLTDLENHPPTVAELDEARQHLIGRWRSAAQSNEEISAVLLSEWVCQGRLRSEAEFAAEVRRVRREDVLRLIPRFVSGAIASVEVPE